MLITRTPYRLSFFGGGLDYPEWFKTKERTRILCAGLDYYCYQTVRELPPFFKHKYRVCYSKVELAESVGEIIHPSAREVIRKYGGSKNIELTHVGDLPAKSGIGSSSAFTVGLINCLSALNGKYMGRTNLALEAIELEQNSMKENVGIQDQCASAFGGFVMIETDGEIIKPRTFVMENEYKRYIKENLLLGYDGIERYSGVASKVITEKIKGKTIDNAMEELSILSEKAIDLFSEKASADQLAEYTKRIRDIKMTINGDIHNERVLDIINATEKAGSKCTRILGAGGGGFFICWAPKQLHNQIKKSVKIKTWVDVRFATDGSRVIYSE